MDHATNSLQNRYPLAIDDGRGFLPDHIGFGAPIGMRDELRQVAAQAGVSVAAFIRGAIEDRLRQIGQPASHVEG